MWRLFGLAFVCVLQACAGGGNNTNNGDIHLNVSYPEYPQTNQPYYSTELEATPVTSADPDDKVTINTITYDLKRASPDTQGPGFNNNYLQGHWLPMPHLKFWGQTLTSSACTNAFLEACPAAKIGMPTDDVLSAWRHGWTGLGVNVMIEDGLKDDHGVITGLLAYRYAPGANYFGLNVIPQWTSNDVFDNQLGRVPTSYPTRIQLGVVNASYTAAMKELIGRDQTQSPWTQPELTKARIAYAGQSVINVNRFKDAGVSGQLTQSKYSDAVITKAAGNDRLVADNEPLNWYLAKDRSINARLLIVGALDRAGSITEPADIASYSNTAGIDVDVSSRFLLASGTIPFDYRSVSINGVVTDLYQGTSFAAPRVAGYVAMLRSKFPNLNATQSASIMLDTASYDTLRCHQQTGGCDPKIYGRGEANLSRALAPVGRIR